VKSGAAVGVWRSKMTKKIESVSRIRDWVKLLTVPVKKIWLRI
jgi:hypothetical protein